MEGHAGSQFVSERLIPISRIAFHPPSISRDGQRPRRYADSCRPATNQNQRYGWDINLPRSG